MIGAPPGSTRTDTLCPYTTLFRSRGGDFMFVIAGDEGGARADLHCAEIAREEGERVGVGPVFRGGAAFGPVGAQRKPARIDASLHRRAADAEGGRSEEHTSELQSLMRIAYAVFCLKKKKQNS